MSFSSSNKDLDRGIRKFDHHKFEKNQKSKVYQEKQKKKTQRREQKVAKAAGVVLPTPEVSQKKRKQPSSDEVPEWLEYQRGYSKDEADEVSIFSSYSLFCSPLSPLYSLAFLCLFCSILAFHSRPNCSPSYQDFFLSDDENGGTVFDENRMELVYNGIYSLLASNPIFPSPFSLLPLLFLLIAVTLSS